jgi:hypothetical protein
MAGTTYTCQLHESKGLCKIIHFSGLEFDLLIHPYIYGEPLIATQPLYFLEEIEAIAKLHVEKPKTITENETEYLIDNYLFKYSLIDDNSRICAKITTPAFWLPDFSDFYQYHDKKNTRALTLDPYNDDSILEIKDLDGNDICFNDYCFPKEFIDEALSESAINIKNIYKTKILIKIIPDDDRDGYFGKIRLLENEGTLLDFTQALRLDYIDSYDTKNKTTVKISSDLDNDVLELPIQKIVCVEKYSPILLSYYFSGLRERNHLLSFIGYYNVLEYYFEDAPVILGVKPTSERKNLRQVIKLITNHCELYDFIAQKRELIAHIEKDIETSSSIKIKAVIIKKEASLLENISDWIYSIRCAVVHSKKRRNGEEEAIFEPYTSQAENISSALVVLKWLSQKCIIKDRELNQQ